MPQHQLQAIITCLGPPISPLAFVFAKSRAESQSVFGKSRVQFSFAVIPVKTRIQDLAHILSLFTGVDSRLHGNDGGEQALQIIQVLRESRSLLGVSLPGNVGADDFPNTLMGFPILLAPRHSRSTIPRYLHKPQRSSCCFPSCSSSPPMLIALVLAVLLCLKTFASRSDSDRCAALIPSFFVLNSLKRYPCPEPRVLSMSGLSPLDPRPFFACRCAAPIAGVSVLSPPSCLSRYGCSPNRNFPRPYIWPAPPGYRLYTVTHTIGACVRTTPLQTRQPDVPRGTYRKLELSAPAGRCTTPPVASPPQSNHPPNVPRGTCPPQIQPDDQTGTRTPRRQASIRPRHAAPCWVLPQPVP